MSLGSRCQLHTGSRIECGICTCLLLETDRGTAHDRGTLQDLNPRPNRARREVCDQDFSDPIWLLAARRDLKHSEAGGRSCQRWLRTFGVAQPPPGGLGVLRRRRRWTPLRFGRAANERAGAAGERAAADVDRLAHVLSLL